MSELDEISFEAEFALRGPTSISCDQYVGPKVNYRSADQSVRNLEFLAVTSSQSRCRNGGFTIEFHLHER